MFVADTSGDDVAAGAAAASTGGVVLAVLAVGAGVGATASGVEVASAVVSDVLEAEAVEGGVAASSLGVSSLVGALGAGGRATAAAAAAVELVSSLAALHSPGMVLREPETTRTQYGWPVTVSKSVIPMGCSVEPTVNLFSTASVLVNMPSKSARPFSNTTPAYEER